MIMAATNQCTQMRRSQPSTFRSFKWRAKLRNPQYVYQYRERIQTPTLQQNGDTSLSNAHHSQPHTSISSTHINHKTPTHKAKPSSRSTSNDDLSVSAKSMKITTRPKAIPRPLSAPSFTANQRARFKKQVFERPFPYPDPRAPAHVSPSFRQRLNELTALEQESILAEEARKRLISNRSQGSRQLFRPVSTTPTLKPTKEAPRRHSTTTCKIETTHQPTGTELCKSISCQEITKSTHKESSESSASVLKQSISLHELVPQRKYDSLIYSYTNTNEQQPSMSLTVLEEFLSGAHDRDSSSSSSGGSESEDDSDDTSSTSSGTGSVINITDSITELALTVNEPELIHLQDSGVQIDVSGETDDPQSDDMAMKTSGATEATTMCSPEPASSTRECKPHKSVSSCSKRKRKGKKRTSTTSSSTGSSRKLNVKAKSKKNSVKQKFSLRSSQHH